MSVNLSDEQATVLQARASAERLSLDEWIAKLARTDQAAANHSSRQTDTPRHIWDIIVDNRKEGWRTI